jgi:hypothetical protein
MKAIRPSTFDLRPCLLALAIATPALAQDTVTVIDPEAPPIHLPYRGGPPAEALREAVARYNDTTVTRLFGSFTVGSATTIQGDVGIYRGTLRVMGRITGRVTIINGSLIVGPGGMVEGDVLLLGGRYQVLPGGQHTGEIRSWSEVAPVYRNPAGVLEIRDRPPTLGELARAQASFEAGGVRTTLSLETGGTYNRVEGLPIILGPVFRVPTTVGDEVRLGLQAIVRTESDPTDQREAFGYVTRLSYEHRRSPRFGLAVDYSRRVEPIDAQPLGLHEVGWAAFLFGRDYRDYYEAEGPGATVWVYPFRTLRLEAAYRYQEEATVPASDPVSIFRDPEPWRPNPLIDDGHYTLTRALVEFDTRNSPSTPTTGWYIRAGVERGRSSDVAPLTLPVEVREPIPSFRDYVWRRGWFDLRRYARINAEMRVNLRATGAGWIGGDPLPIQRRAALGGPDLLPGYGFRAENCAPATFNDAARTALCDRVMAFQAEVRYRFRLGLREKLGEQEWMAFERLLGADRADLVVFGDAGKGWLSGDGPGRVPNNRLPTAGEWAYDAGIGLDLDGIALYLASPVSRFDPRVTFRLQRRF